MKCLEIKRFHQVSESQICSAELLTSTQAMYHTMLSYVKSSYLFFFIMLCFIMLYYVMFYYVMLCHHRVH